LDEVWVSRIVDVKQVRPPNNLHDALANLCMLFAGAVGDDDVKLFKYHAQYGPKPWPGRIVEIQHDTDITFEWTHKNLANAEEHGYRAAEYALKNYP
jgi:hypothetical protein